jgi:hypothetical protein
MTVPTLAWSETEPGISVDDPEQLDRAVETILKRSSADRPTIAQIRGDDYTLTFGLGASESFVQTSEADDEPPYFVTVGDADAEGERVFHFMGVHHTEIPRRHIVPTSVALEIVREFFRTCRRSAAVPWEEI